MTRHGREGLLGADDPAPVQSLNSGGRSPFLLIGDHAGRAIPKKLADLGLSLSDRTRHIAWDIGVQSLGEQMAARIDAAFLYQAYSRLVVDCNRDPKRTDAMPIWSDGTFIAGNDGLTAHDRAERVAAIHEPYHLAIAAEIDRRVAGGYTPVLVSLHSFTPRLSSIPRPWSVGVLHDGGETGFAHRVLAGLRREFRDAIGGNEPYRMDRTDHTVPRHAYPRKLPYVELEVRQDVIEVDDGQARWSAILARALTAALRYRP
ncbi:N-formylglutamate amidohydrolase [Sphingomonas sp. DBB INV C78]|uniref:N-formylglutamate amidohydrolase n=1 Tax=Sphingomonas sp. DBB INV C78 TaxID=3349434 RepID=UPI0036D38B58